MTTGNYYTKETVPSNSGGVSVLPDTNILRISVFADDRYRNDMRYLVAAIRAIQQYTGRSIELNSAGGGDWIFWLSERPLPEGAKYGHVFEYVKGKERLTESWFRGMEDVSVRKEINDREGPGALPVWEDGFGQPLLSSEWRPEEGGARHYRFFSRLDPDWNGLPGSVRFPILLQKLLFGTGHPLHPPAKGPDLRVLDPGQVHPVKTAGIADETEFSPAGEMPFEARTNLDNECWILVTLIFLAERVLAFRNPKRSRHG
jgi:hypothetical protein